MALAVAVRAGEHRDAAGRMHADVGALVQARARAERAHHRGRRDAAGLEIGGNADAAQLAARLRRRAPCLEAGAVGRLQRRVQRRLVVAAVVLQRHRRLVRERVGGNEVLPPQLDAVHAGVVRDHVHQALQQERRLRPAGAAIGVHRHGVGEHRLHLAVDHRGLVNAGQQRGVQIGRHARREGGQIGAHVGQRRDAQRQEIAVRVQRHLGGADMVAAVRVGHEAFVALGGPLHRPAQLAGGPGDDRLLGVVVDLRAEAAADVGRHDAQLVLRDVQHEGAHQQADDVRVLAGGVQRVVAGGRIEVADRGARLHRVRDQPVVGQVQLHHLRRLGEDAVHHGLVADMPVVAEIAGGIVVHQRRRPASARPASSRRRAGPDSRSPAARPRPSPPAWFRRSPPRRDRRHGAPCRPPAPDAPARPSASRPCCGSASRRAGRRCRRPPCRRR